MAPKAKRIGSNLSLLYELPHKKCYRKENRKRRFIYMSPQSKEEYFEVLYKRYKEATRKEKTVIITECTLCANISETLPTM